MVSINYASREVSCKIVYYGPGLSGKTTNLQYVHKKVPTNTKGKLISLATDADRTLYFDFLPINIGTINGFAAKFQLYTVPGQVYYNATRKLVLRGVDGLVFVADSQPDKMDENIESLNNLKENLEEYGYNLDEIPIVIQYNKQDLTGISSPDEMRPVLNPQNWPEFKASATVGFGVFDTLKCILKLVLEKAKSGGTVPSSASAGQAVQAPVPGAAAQAVPPPQVSPGVPPQQPVQAQPPAPQPPQAVPPQPQFTTAGSEAAPQYTQAAQMPPVQQQGTGQATQATSPPVQMNPVREEYAPPQSPSQPELQPPPPEPPMPSQAYRPFPGNTIEDEQLMNVRHQQRPAAASSEQIPEISNANAPEPGNNDRFVMNANPTGTPRMEPSLKTEKPKKPKKRSFFKRLFGLK